MVAMAYAPDKNSTVKTSGLLRPGAAAPTTPPVTPPPTTPTTTTPGTTPTGVPQVPDYSVATKVSEITAKNSPLMKQAQTQGMQFANKRGLLNSSIAAGAAQNEVIRAATPIASQDSAQAQGLQLAGMNLAANAQDKASAAAATIEQTYSNSFSNLMNNESIPKAVRDQYLTHLGKLRDSSYALLEQLYGVQLQWASPTP